MRRAAAAVAALVALLAAAPVSAQVHTRRVEVHWFRLPSPPPVAPPVATVLALDCTRSWPRGRAHCRVASLRSLEPRGGALVPSLDACVGTPHAPTQAIADVVRTSVEAGAAGTEPVPVSLPAGAPPVTVVVRWTDVSPSTRCVAWRPCTAIDCHMGGDGRECARSVPATTRATSLVWGTVRDGRLATAEGAPFYETAAVVDRIESVATAPGDAAVAHFVEAIDLAVDAFAAGDDAGLARGMQQAHDALAAAIAAAPPAAAGLRSALETLERVASWRGTAQLVSPCARAPAPAAL